MKRKREKTFVSCKTRPIYIVVLSLCNLWPISVSYNATRPPPHIYPMPKSSRSHTKIAQRKYILRGYCVSPPLSRSTRTGERETKEKPFILSSTLTYDCVRLNEIAPKTQKNTSKIVIKREPRYGLQEERRKPKIMENLFTRVCSLLFSGIRCERSLARNFEQFCPIRWLLACLCLSLYLFLTRFSVLCFGWLAGWLDGWMDGRYRFVEQREYSYRYVAGARCARWGSKISLFSVCLARALRMNYAAILSSTFTFTPMRILVGFSFSINLFPQFHMCMTKKQLSLSPRRVYVNSIFVVFFMFCFALR